MGIHHAIGQTDDTVLGHDGYYAKLTDMFHNMGHGFTLVTMTNTQTEWFGLFLPKYDVVTAYEAGACPGDFNGNDQVDILDLVQFNSLYGASCVGFCQEDMNPDGTIDILDFIPFNSVFGTICPMDDCD